MQMARQSAQREVVEANSPNRTKLETTLYGVTNTESEMVVCASMVVAKVIRYRPGVWDNR